MESKIDFKVGDALRILFPVVLILHQQQEAKITEVWSNQGWDLSVRRPLNDLGYVRIHRIPQHSQFLQKESH